MSYENIQADAKLLEVKIQNDIYELIQNGFLFIEDIKAIIDTFAPTNKKIVTRDSHTLDSTNSTLFMDQKLMNLNHNEEPVRIIKNNKVVYAKPSFQNEKKNNSKKKITFINRGHRGSKYRGVSKNGNQWQVLIMVKKRKNYFGSYDTEYHAARVYDIVAIQNYGNKAKTNFLYSPEELNKIYQIDFDNKISLEQYYTSI